MKKKYQVKLYDFYSDDKTGESGRFKSKRKDMDWYWKNKPNVSHGYGIGRVK